MPAEIGLAAERVLTGCLDMNVASRWTIAMVDEVAWGIGWTSHDSSPISESEPDYDPIPVHNRARTISVVISDSDSPPHSHSIMSDESPLTGHRSCGSPSSSRSRSPNGLPHSLRYIPASLSSLNDSILGNDTARNSPNPPTPSSFARGRPRTKASSERADSRSLSPSMVPLTPELDGSSSPSRLSRAYGTDLPHENELGRSRGTSRLRWRVSELDDIEEMTAREKWGASRSRHSSRSRLRDDDCSRSVGRRAFDLLNKWDDSPRGRSSRAGSQPPRSPLSSGREKRLGDIDCDWVVCRTSSTTRDGTRGETTVGRMKVRSRSVGFDFGVERARTRKLAPL